jgi:hypothetical protein
MRGKQYISKCISILLLVVLLQKAGGGLVLHDWLHVQSTCTSHDDPVVTETAINCSCIDDFYMPFTGAPETFIEPLVTIPAEFAAIPPIAIPYSLPAYHSLRGPPVTIS